MFWKGRRMLVAYARAFASDASASARRGGRKGGGGDGEEGGAPENQAKRQRPAPGAVEEDVASAAKQPQDLGAAAAPAAPDAAAAGNNTAGREGQKGTMGMPKSKFIGVAIRKSGQFAAVHRKKVVGLYEKEEHAAMAFDLASTSTLGSAILTRGSAKVNFRETPIAAERMREEGKDPMECLEELWERLRGERVVPEEHGTASEIRPETQSQGRYDCACVFLPPGNRHYACPSTDAPSRLIF
jgi:hypothetical protein